MFANDKGPQPMRPMEYPRGLPWLTAIRKHQVHLGNILTDVTARAALAQVANSPGLLFIEFPEDLGAIKHGRWAGQRPASILAKGGDFSVAACGGSSHSRTSSV